MGILTLYVCIGRSCKLVSFRINYRIKWLSSYRPKQLTLFHIQQQTDRYPDIHSCSVYVALFSREWRLMLPFYIHIDLWTLGQQILPCLSVGKCLLRCVFLAYLVFAIVNPELWKVTLGPFLEILCVLWVLWGLQIKEYLCLDPVIENNGIFSVYQGSENKPLVTWELLQLRDYSFFLVLWLKWIGFPGFTQDGKTKFW
jgi:hypothetical protein